MGLIVPIIIMVVLWIVMFFFVERTLKYFYRKEQIRRIKEILYDRVDFTVIKSKRCDQLLLDGERYDL